MRLVGIAAVVIVFVFALVSGAFAGPDDNWAIWFKASDQTGGNSSVLLIGAQAGATNPPVIGPEDSASSVIPTSTVCVRCFDMGPGPNGYGYSKDLRAPLQPGETHIWNIKVWVQPGSSVTCVKLTSWNPPYPLDLNGSIPVDLKVSHDPTGLYAPDTLLYHWDGSSQGTDTAPQFSTTFSNVAAMTGLQNAVSLRVIAGPAVPEPASLTVLLGGVAALAGSGIRRRS